MTTHRHQDSRAKWTTSVTDPDLSGLATKAELAALAMRVAALEAVASPMTVGLPLIPRQPAVLMPAVFVSSVTVEGEWIDRSFFAA